MLLCWLTYSPAFVRWRDGGESRSAGQRGVPGAAHHLSAPVNESELHVKGTLQRNRRLVACETITPPLRTGQVPMAAGLKRLSLSELLTTDTELSAMAAAAIIGFKRR